MFRLRRRQAADTGSGRSPAELNLPGQRRNNEVLTPIHRPDTHKAFDHPLPTLTPNQGDCRLLVVQKIQELADRGALDAGTAYVLDAFIDELLAGWLPHVEQQAKSRLDIAGMYHAAIVQNLHDELGRLRELDRNVSRLKATYDRLNALLTNPGRTLGAPEPPQPEVIDVSDGRRPISVPPSRAEIPESDLRQLMDEVRLALEDPEVIDMESGK